MWKTSLHCTTEGNLQFHPLKNISSLLTPSGFRQMVRMWPWTRNWNEVHNIRATSVETLSYFYCFKIKKHQPALNRANQTLWNHCVWSSRVLASSSWGSAISRFVSSLERRSEEKIGKIRKDEKGKHVKAMWKHRKSPAPMGPMPCAVPNLSRQCGFTAFTKVYGTSRPSTSTTSTCSTMQHPNCTNPVPIHHFAGRSFWFSMPCVKSWDIFSI